MPQLARARERGIPIIGEVELASDFSKGNIVAVTGSNGKTTTTTLAGDMIAASGRDTLVGGNIGTPAVTLRRDRDRPDLGRAGDQQLSAGDALRASAPRLQSS